MNLQQQYAFFLKNHYCMFPSALSRQEVDRANAAIDALCRERGFSGSTAPRWSDSQALLTHPEFDFLLRHPSWFPLAHRIFEGDIVLNEFSIMIRPGNQARPTKPEGWHQDFGVCDKDPLGITSLSVIYYTTDVDRTTARYSLLPGSQSGLPKPEPAAPAPGINPDDVKGEFEVVGPAGSLVLVNAGIWHTGKPGVGPRERRTIHLYMQRACIPPVGNHTTMPRRLWDVPDPELRRYFSHFNQTTKEYAAALRS